jgi:hypothetical protein
MTFINPTRVKIEYPIETLTPQLDTAYDATNNIFLGAENFTITNGAPSLSSIGGSPVWLLDAGVTEYVGATIDRGFIPARWVSFSVEVWWANVAATAGDVRWALGHGQFGEGDAIGLVTINSVTAASPATENVAARTTLTSMGVPATTDPLQTLRIGRAGADAADTLGNDAAFLGLRLVKVS